MAAGAVPRRRHKRASRLTNLNIPIVGRSVFFNHLHRKAAELEAVSRFPLLMAFLPQNFFPWIWSYLKYVFTPRCKFLDYINSGKTGVYKISPRPGTATIKIGIAGDWGTGTQEAETIADLMRKTNIGEPDFTIHLGDVYYVGDQKEIEENCLGEHRAHFDGVTWPHGREGSFAMNGNHEMYANGKPYYRTFLPTLGLHGDRTGQIASFFALETEYWRILAIDTGYNSVGVPILSQIPGINSIPFIGGDCHLEKKLLSWLRKTVRPLDSRKATLLLSHHEYFTAFGDHNYTKPAKQLAEFFRGQEIVWMWGHEHRLAIYDKCTRREGMTVFGRCNGHAGMPVELGSPNLKRAPLRYYDTRSHELDDGTKVGQNGYVLATIEEKVLTLEYRDVADMLLLIETFTPVTGGTLQYTVQDFGILTKV